MPQSVSIHVGVNDPQHRHGPARPSLRHSENTAWLMAVLASQAGYDSLQVLRGAAATRQAVHERLAGAAGALRRGDTLFVSFSGHGDKQTDTDFDERHGSDESWCLYDGDLIDDKLAGYWRLFDPGVRLVVVSESCYSGGIGRTGERLAAATPRAGRRPVMRGGVRSPVHGVSRNGGGAVLPGASCIGEPPRDPCEIRASVLLLTASGEDEPAQDGLFSRHLLEVWSGGAFRGSYCSLYMELRDRVMAEAPTQQPNILMLGAADPGFPLEPAFHVGREARRTVRYR